MSERYADNDVIGNPSLPAALTADGFTQGPMPGSSLPCGCHVRRPDYEAILCPTHLAELNAEHGNTPEGSES